MGFCSVLPGCLRSLRIELALICDLLFILGYLLRKTSKGVSVNGLRMVPVKTMAVTSDVSRPYSVARTVVVTAAGMAASTILPCRAAPCNPNARASRNPMSGPASKRSPALNCRTRMLWDHCTCESSSPSRMIITGILPLAARSTVRPSEAGRVI